VGTSWTAQPWAVRFREQQLHQLRRAIGTTSTVLAPTLSEDARPSLPPPTSQAIGAAVDWPSPISQMVERPAVVSRVGTRSVSLRLFASLRRCPGCGSVSKHLRGPTGHLPVFGEGSNKKEKGQRLVCKLSMLPRCPVEPFSCSRKRLVAKNLGQAMVRSWVATIHQVHPPLRLRQCHKVLKHDRKPWFSPCCHLQGKKPIHLKRFHPKREKMNHVSGTPVVVSAFVALASSRPSEVRGVFSAMSDECPGAGDAEHVRC
jgi:hypothetical protein